MTRKKINIKIKISWFRDKNPENFFKFMPYLTSKYKFVSQGSPDFVLYNQSYRDGPYKKIFYTSENVSPDMSTCDWALTFKYNKFVKSNRHLRLPNYVRLGAGSDLIKGKEYNPQAILTQKSMFCAFVHGHNVRLRNMFCKELSKYKKVNAPGRSCNNMHGLTAWCRQNKMGKLTKYEEKIAFFKQHKFVISFENAKSPGYTTEKIYHAMLGNAIPIYWGNPLINNDFNTKSFVNAHSIPIKSEEKLIKELVDQVVHLDTCDSAYMQKLKQPWYHHDRLSMYTNPKNIVSFFDKIFEG